MRVTSLWAERFRAFAQLPPIALSSINVFIGPNNAGKSSILRALHLMQGGYGNIFADVRLGTPTAEVGVVIEDVNSSDAWSRPNGYIAGPLKMTIQTNQERNGGGVSYVFSTQNSNINLNAIPSIEPNHFIVPYLSKRKSVSYNEDVREKYALAVGPEFTNLAAKLSRLSNGSFPGNDIYSSTCRAILGFVVTAVPSLNGQRPGVYLPDRRTIPIEQMGEGVPNIAGLLADLTLSKGKMFLIEEPENDLHPKALKALLELIVESSKDNQFVVSTHSNIVAHHLGAASNSLLYKVSTVPDTMPPQGAVTLVEATPGARIDALRELGYTPGDFDLWDGWLVLEESSAERLIRDYLIPWFVPKLARVRTLAAGGVDKVDATFEDFHRLVRFMHLEAAYQLSSWVRVDGDEKGKAVVAKLRDSYNNWDEGRFKTFSKSQFESYYPEHFSDQISAVLAMPRGQPKQQAKKSLLDEVRAWLDSDVTRGRQALEKSAAEVIADLRQISAELTVAHG